MVFALLLGIQNFPKGRWLHDEYFLYIKDVVELYISIAEFLENDKRTFSVQVFNAGSNTPQAVK